MICGYDDLIMLYLCGIVDYITHNMMGNEITVTLNNIKEKDQHEEAK